MPRQSHFDRVRALVSGHAGVPESEITLETRLVEDLGIDGDTGYELIEGFVDEFGVDMSRMALFNYFEDEPPFSGRSCLIPLVARLSPRFRAYLSRVARGRREITVRNLVASARARRWITPSVPRRDADLTLFDFWDLATLGGSVGMPIGLAIWSITYETTSLQFALGGSLFVLGMLWALLILRFVKSFHWLRRLDAAATFEEQHLTAAD